VVEQLGTALRAVTGEGSLAMILVEQRVDIALELSDRCAVMERGRIVFTGTSAALRAGNDEFATLMGFAAAAP
jgi:branched-chain amino acid transport system ATP-binding protein